MSKLDLNLDLEKQLDNLTMDDLANTLKGE